MSRNHTVIGYKWKCEICSQKSKKWLPRWKAHRTYRVHLNNYHNGVPIQPILYSKYIGGDGSENKRKKRKDKTIKKTNRKN